MRILQLSQFYRPVIGGEERHVETLSQCLAARGHEVTLLTFATQGDAGVSVDAGVRVVRVKPMAARVPGLYSDASWPHAMPVSDLSVSRAVAAEIRRSRPDVAHAHNWIVNSALAPLRRAGVPLIQTLHDYGQVCATQRLMWRRRAECTGPEVRKCLGCSREKFGLLRGTATVLGNGVMSRRRSTTVQKFIAVSTAVARGVAPQANGSSISCGVASEVVANFIPDAQVLDKAPLNGPDAPITFVGDLSRDKGVHILLAAYSQLGVAPSLQLIGRITPETPQSLPAGAHATGPLPHSRVIDYVRSGQLLIAPSTWQEPCPTVVLEGMAAAKPVIASRIGGITDMVDDGKTGILVPPADPEALSSAIRRLLSDKDLAHSMGLAGRDRARQFTVTAIVDRLERLYSEQLPSAN